MLALLGNLGALSAGLRVATVDDAAIAEGLTVPATASQNRLHEFKIGRIYSGVKFWLQEAHMGLRSDALHTAVRLAAFFSAALAAAWFTWELFHRRDLAAFVLLAQVAWLQLTVTYHPFLSFPLLWIGWTAVWSMGALTLRPESPAVRAGIVIAFAVALSVHEGTAVFIAWPLILRIATDGWRAWRQSLRLTAACGIVLAAYVILYLVLRQAAMNDPATVYRGAKLSLVPGQTIFALLVFSFSAMPGLETMVDRWRGAGEGLLITPGEWWQRTVPALHAGDLLVAGLLGLAVWFVWRSSSPAESRRFRPALAGALLFALLAPNALMACTEKYQEWSHQRMWPYYYASMSYQTWVICLGLVAAWLMDLPRRADLKVVVRSVTVAVTLLLAIGIWAKNRETVGLLRQHSFTHYGEYYDWITQRPAAVSAPAKP